MGSEGEIIALLGSKKFRNNCKSVPGRDKGYHHQDSTSALMLLQCTSNPLELADRLRVFRGGTPRDLLHVLRLKVSRQAALPETTFLWTRSAQDMSVGAHDSSSAGEEGASPHLSVNPAPAASANTPAMEVRSIVQNEHAVIGTFDL